MAPTKPDADDVKPVIPRSPSKPRKAWSDDEERAFMQAVNRVVEAHLWLEAKDDPLLQLRKANGVREHWKSVYKKWQK